MKKQFFRIQNGVIAESVIAETAPGPEWLPSVSDVQPAFNPASQTVVPDAPVIEQTQVRFTWKVVALSQASIDAAADRAEHDAVKATRTQLGADIDDSIADQAQAQAYIDLVAPTNAERNQEVQNSARRDKSAEQRYRRLARAVRQILKEL